MNRLLATVRIQLVNLPSVLGWPLGIMSVAFAISFAIFAVLGDTVPPDERGTGGLISMYVTMFVVFIVTMTQVFPFTLGLGVTRRTFYGATSLVLLGQALVFGVLLTLLAAIERVTGGWGIGLEFFGWEFLVQDNVLAQLLVYAVPLAALAYVGVVLGTTYQRWGQTGVWIACVGTGVALGGLAVLVTWQRWWPAVGSFFTEQSTFALLAGYPLLLAALLAGAGWFMLRRATA